MAEAHSAVAFSFAITHEGVSVNYDREVLHVIWTSGIRSWKRGMRRFVNNVKCGVFPATLSSFALVVGGYNAIYLSRDSFGHSLDPTLGLVDFLAKHIRLDEPAKGIVACTLSGFAVWYGLFLVMKYSLKVLLMYKGWMYEARGRGRTISLQSRLWALGVKILTGFSRPMLYSYQSSLPKLPLPGLKDTTTRYLRSVRPLLDDENYSRMEKLTIEFEKGIGRKLQRYLFLKSWWATNYVSDWWEEFVYLRGRSPIMVNSNFYGIDAILINPTKIQSARAANVTHSAFLFRRCIDRQQIQPIMVQNLVPLCSAQYERTFNTTRIPGYQTDKLVHFDDSTHIIVYHAGRYFKVPCYYKGQLLNPRQLQCQFEHILEEESLPEKGETMLGALTAGEREHWALARNKYFSSGVNRTSLEAIEKAAFVVVLDEEAYDYDPNDPSKLDRFGRSMLHGKGYDRWYDKSFNIIVAKNGRALAISDDAKPSLDSSIRKLLLSEVFWDRTEVILKLMKPVADASTAIEGDNKNLSLVMKVFSDLELSFKESFSSSPILESEEDTFRKIIPERKKFLVKGINLAANLVDPRYCGSHLSGEEAVDAMQEIFEIATQLPDVDATQIVAELADYRSKSNLFSKQFIWSAVKKTSPSSWWNGICSSTHLSRVASNILQLPPSSASVERSFSRHALVHSVRRNSLTTDRAAKLVFIGQNLALGNMDDATFPEPEPEPQPSTSRDTASRSKNIPTPQLELDSESDDSEGSIDDPPSLGPGDMISLYDEEEPEEEQQL